MCRYNLYYEIVPILNVNDEIHLNPFFTGPFYPGWVVYGRNGARNEYDRDLDAHRRTKQTRKIWGKDDKCDINEDE